MRFCLLVLAFWGVLSCRCGRWHWYCKYSDALTSFPTPASSQVLRGQRKIISFTSRRMSLLRLVAVPPLAKPPVVPPCPALYPSHPGKQALWHKRRSFASVPGWSSSLCGASVGLFPPSAAFLRSPAHFLRFASCFVLFRFLSPALLGFASFCLLLVLFLLFHTLLLSGHGTSAIATTPAANQTPLENISP